MIYFLVHPLAIIVLAVQIHFTKYEGINEWLEHKTTD